LALLESNQVGIVLETDKMSIGGLVSM